MEWTLDHKEFHSIYETTNDEEIITKIFEAKTSQIIKWLLYNTLRKYLEVILLTKGDQQHNLLTIQNASTTLYYDSSLIIILNILISYVHQRIRKSGTIIFISIYFIKIQVK